MTSQEKLTNEIEENLQLLGMQYFMVTEKLSEYCFSTVERKTRDLEVTD